MGTVLPDWKDEDEYLTYLSKMWDKLDRDDPPLSAKERFHKYLTRHWISLLCEAISEADTPFFSNCKLAYDKKDSLLMGELVRRRVREYAIQCAKAKLVIDEGELDD